VATLLDDRLRRSTDVPESRDSDWPMRTRARKLGACDERDANLRPIRVKEELFSPISRDRLIRASSRGSQARRECHAAS